MRFNAIPAIQIQGLTKRYGARVAVNDIHLDVPAGVVLGLLGRNGAGKSTTINCALGLIAPSSGTTLFAGVGLDVAMRGRVAYVPETPAMYGWMTLKAHIEMRRRLYRSFDPARAQALADRFEISTEKPIRRLSKGGRTAASLVLAFAQNADMLFLDEPCSGLDPVAQRVALDAIVSAASDGAALLFSSHDISQIERVAENVAIIDHGRIVINDNLETLRYSHKVVEAIFADPPQMIDLAIHANIARIDVKGKIVRAYVTGEANGIADALSSRGARSARVLDRTLEELFIAATTERAYDDL